MLAPGNFVLANKKAVHHFFPLILLSVVRLM